MFAPAVEVRPKPAHSSPESSRRPRVGTARGDQPAFMTSSPALQASSGWTSLLIKQRERAACPQLRCVPSDLRGDGPRHASHESLPPSKPCRPHIRERAATLLAMTPHCTPHGGAGQMVLWLELVLFGVLT